MNARAALLHEDLRLDVGERELAEIGPGDARIGVEWAGLCGSDLHVMRTGAWVQEWPATLGHEVFGRVEEAGPALEIETGARVVLDSRLPCLACEACARDPNTCPNIRFLGEARPGGFAAYTVVPGRSLHRVPDGLEGEDAVLAEPLAVVVHALNELTSVPERTLIVGHGPIGALAHIELRRRRADPAVSVAEPARLRFELAAALEADVRSSAAEFPEGGYDLVIDAAGYHGSLGDAITAAGPGATILALAISNRPASIRSIELIEKRITLKGLNAFIDELPEAIDLLAAEPWRYRPVITDAVSLDELPEVAAAQLAEPEEVKVVIHP
jgi:threonine dehydrogenase-like Zn-dependent dehydrogenase